MSEWIRRAEELGNAAPYSIRIPYGTRVNLPKVCAGCGEAAVKTAPMARGADDETTMIELPVCGPCFAQGTGDYWRRKLQMGCGTFLAMAAGFGGSLAFSSDGAKIGSWAVAGALLLAAYALGRGTGRDQRVPLVRRRPHVLFDARSMEVFASSAFILAAYEAEPGLKHVGR